MEPQRKVSQEEFIYSLSRFFCRRVGAVFGRSAVSSAGLWRGAPLSSLAYRHPASFVQTGLSGADPSRTLDPTARSCALCTQCITLGRTILTDLLSDANQ